MLRRLYSTLAGGSPGIGLLVMRLVVGSVLLLSTGLMLWSDPPSPMTLTSASLAAALAMLGPGRWSIDARLFGWKRIEQPVHKK